MSTFLTSLTPTLGLFGSLVSTGVSAYAQYQTGLANNYSKQWNAEASRVSAQIATAKAKAYTQLGVQEKAEVIQEYDALRSKQRSEYAAGGVDVNYGSALEQQVATTKLGVYEGQKAQYTRDMQAWEMTTEAAQHEMTALQNEASMTNPWLPAIQAGVSGVSGAYQQYGQWQK